MTCVGRDARTSEAMNDFQVTMGDARIH
jgi:hypothetical protein